MMRWKKIIWNLKGEKNPFISNQEHQQVCGRKKKRRKYQK